MVQFITQMYYNQRKKGTTLVKTDFYIEKFKMKKKAPPLPLPSLTKVRN